ncbi:MAG TPA: solute carrier family 23 protein [Mesorhizobium sp.]|nr:solute carrier family 23 protein [Mesorhizobium sp.]
MSVIASGLERFRGFLGRARAPSPGKKPAELIYGVDDVPPLYIILLSGLQHVGLVTIFLIYPLLIVKEVGASMTLAANILSLALIALGIATFLQGLPKGPVGSGFLCPANHTAIYLAPSLAAVKLGGLPLLFGMTIFAGVVECILSPVLRRIRPLIPPELSGLVIFFVGMTVAAVGFRYIAGIGSSGPIGASNVIVALITLGVTAGLNVWAKGNARLFCALIGMAIGYLAAIATGILSTEQFRMIAELPLLALPSLSHLHWTMSAEMIPPFIIIAIAATLKTVGVITACQRINDASWVRPDMTSLSRGVLADGMGTAAAGALGSVGLNTSTPCTGLAAATGLTSRVVGYAAGGILMLLGLLPMLAGVFVLMPRPVMGAALIFAACFILINGLQAITSRMLDARRTLVIGLALSAGFAAEIFPNMADRLPVLKPVVGSSLVLGTLTALLLNLLFLLGQRQRVAMSIDPSSADALTEVKEFFDAQGRSWGARHDIMERASFGVSQAVESIREMWEPRGPIRIDARFDEFNLDVQVAYRGDPIELPERRPSNKEIIETDDGHRRLAGYMLRRNADRVAISRMGDESVLQFHFDH